MVDLGVSARPQETAPLNLGNLDRTRWDIKIIGGLENAPNQLIAIVPVSQNLREADIAAFARENPSQVTFLWLESGTGSRSVPLTSEEREAAISAMTTPGATFNSELARVSNRSKLQEFTSGLDGIIAATPFDPQRVLYELYKREVFSRVSEERDADLRESYQQALAEKMRGLLGDGFDLEAALRDEQTFTDFIDNFSMSMGSGRYYDACAYALPLISSLYTARMDELAGMVVMALEEFAGIPSELVMEWHQEGRLTGTPSEQQVWAMLNDPRVESFLSTYSQLPRDYREPNESEAHLLMRQFSYPLSELIQNWSGLSDQEKDGYYSEIRLYWRAASNDPSVANAMAMEFFRATGMDINSPFVAGADARVREQRNLQARNE